MTAVQDFFYLFCDPTAQIGPSRFIVKVSRSHTLATTSLNECSDRGTAAAYRTQRTQRWASTPSAGLESAMSTIERH